jgi:predicted anti-sigma-YlaC factor YlaD
MDACPDDALRLDYLNGLVSEKERARFDSHLAACPECRRDIEDLRKTAAAVAALGIPPVPEAWAAAAKDRLRAKGASPAAPTPGWLAPALRKTSLFQFGLVASGVIAALGFLLWLVLRGTVERWLPGLSAAGLGISDPRAARTADLVVWILSFHALLLVPSVIDGIWGLARRDARRSRPGRASGFFAF